jgi:hypothetical protein
VRTANRLLARLGPMLLASSCRLVLVRATGPVGCGNEAGGRVSRCECIQVQASSQRIRSHQVEPSCPSVFSSKASNTPPHTHTIRTQTQHRQPAHLVYCSGQAWRRRPSSRHPLPFPFPGSPSPLLLIPASRPVLTLRGCGLDDHALSLLATAMSSATTPVRGSNDWS